jgi:hypothetical protein
VLLLVDVANTSAVAICEVTRAYAARIEPSAVTRPRKELKGSTKIFVLSFGDIGAAVNMHVKHTVSGWGEDADVWLVVAGLYVILICNSSASILQRVIFTVTKSTHWTGL